MALPWVLLERMVYFADARAAATAGEGSTGGKGKAAATSEPSPQEELSPEELLLTPQEAMAAMTPSPAIVAPPAVTHLTMLRRTSAHSMGQGVYGGEISSTDKNIVVLYTGSYRPGNGGFSGDGCYLVYDASSKALSAIPPLPGSAVLGISPMAGLGRSAAVLRHGGSTVGGYTLAELVTTREAGLPEAELWVWSRSSTTASAAEGKWIHTPIRLPLPADLCGPTHFFRIDMAFSFAGSHICWVDLLTGILVCDLSTPTEGRMFRFIPLPTGYSLYLPNDYRLRLQPEEFRSMGAACGAIKFVALVGYSGGGYLAKDVTLKTWTLNPDLTAWKEGKSLSVGELWDCESFKELELPRVMPMCPVLSMNEDEVIYIILNDVDRVDDVDEFGDFHGVDLVPKAHYRIRLDMLQSKVLCCTKSSTGTLSFLTPTLLASEFSAHVKDPKDRQRAEQAREVGAGSKRVKY